MKIRIKGNSVRFRLTKTDVATFGEKGYVEEKTEFGHADFVYALRKSDEVSLIAEMDNNKIIMLVPEAIAHEWVSTSMVGFNNTVVLPSGSKLYLLVEKDFVCLDETIEDQSDNYENPLANRK